jgi:hypothetical protein
MTTHKFHLCPKCSRRFTPKYKVSQYKGDQIICPRCQKTLRPPKQARSVERLLQWSNEAGISLRFSKDLGSELLYVCDGRWKQLDVRVTKDGKISVYYGRMEDSLAYDKRHFMELVQRHREYIADKPNEDTASRRNKPINPVLRLL